jgi:hypothetical protein
MISVCACVCVCVCVVSCCAAYTTICLCDPLFVNKLNGRVLKTVMRDIRENIFATQDGSCKESVTRIFKILL